MADSRPDFSRREVLKGAAATLLLSISPIGLASSTHVVAVRIWPSSTYTRVTIESSQPLNVKQFMLAQPDRLVIDISGVILNPVLQDVGQLVQPHDPFLKLARVGQFNKETVRLVLELKQPVNPNVFGLKPIAEFRDRLVIDLYPAKGVNSNGDDPLLALLREYNRGDLNLEGESVSQKPITPPKRDKNRPWVIMIDPGHGGEDPGAIGKHRTKEKVIVLQISRRLRDLIKKEPKMKVYMTRNDDVFIPLRVRVAKARAQKADLFISIHADAFTNRSARGSSIFALSTKGATSAAAQYLADTQNEADEIGGVGKSGDRYLDHTIFDLVQTATINDSLALGNLVLGRLGKVNPLHKSYVEQAGFSVLRSPDIPSILIETAFISNLEEERKLRSAKFQQQIAQAIFNGIKAFLSSSMMQARRG